MNYNPENHYWRVDDHGNENEVWSSAASAYVADDDATYEAWIADGGMTTGIATEADLWAVLAVAAPDRLPGETAAQDARKDVEIDRADAVLFRIAFDHENRIRALEGQNPVTPAQFRNAVKAQI